LTSGVDGKEVLAGYLADVEDGAGCGFPTTLRCEINSLTCLWRICFDLGDGNRILVFRGGGPECALGGMGGGFRCDRTPGFSGSIYFLRRSSTSCWHLLMGGKAKSAFAWCDFVTPHYPNLGDGADSPPHLDLITVATYRVGADGAAGSDIAEHVEGHTARASSARIGKLHTRFETRKRNKGKGGAPKAPVSSLAAGFLFLFLWVAVGAGRMQTAGA
jgi:hypothetical protein